MNDFFILRNADNTGSFSVVRSQSLETLRSFGASFLLESACSGRLEIIDQAGATVEILDTRQRVSAGSSD